MSSTAVALFADRPLCAALYERLVRELAEIGEYRVEEKKTSLHVVAGRAAFLGIHPRREGLRLNVVLDRELEGPRVVKCEKVSSKSFHNEVDVKSEGQFDDELRGWLREAYERVTA
jgi:hypothetical protein